MERIFERTACQLAEDALDEPPFFVPIVQGYFFRLEKRRKAIWKLAYDEQAPELATAQRTCGAVLRCAAHRIDGFNLLSHAFLSEYQDALLQVVLWSELENRSTSCIISLKYFFPLPARAAELPLMSQAKELYSLYAPFARFCEDTK